MLCKSCGYFNQDNSDLCGQCGMRLIFLHLFPTDRIQLHNFHSRTQELHNRRPLNLARILVAQRLLKTITIHLLQKYMEVGWSKL